MWRRKKEVSIATAGATTWVVSARGGVRHAGLHHVTNRDLRCSPHICPLSDSSLTCSGFHYSTVETERGELRDVVHPHRDERVRLRVHFPLG